MKYDKIKYIKTRKLNKKEKKELKILKKLRSLAIEIINNDSKKENKLNGKITINHNNNCYNINISIERL
jgi:hypothetical protein